MLCSGIPELFSHGPVVSRNVWETSAKKAAFRDDAESIHTIRIFLQRSTSSLGKLQD